MNELNPAFENLSAQLKSLHHYKSILSLISWDQETFMPSAAAQNRAEQIELLSSHCHQLLCSSEMGDALDLALEQLGDDRSSMLQTLRKDREKALKIPASLVKDLALTCSLAQNAWVQARQNQNSKEFLPLLERVFELKKAEAGCFEGNAYDVLLDQYEPGLKQNDLDPIFADLGPFLGQWTENLRNVDFGTLKGPFPADRQKQMGDELLKIMGFDLEKGRLDVSEHPFTMGMHPADVRLTARYREDCLEDGLFSILHEGGHGLYEQGLPMENAWNPWGEALSLGIHESQSRFWENQVGRNFHFWKNRWPLLSQFPQLELNSFYRAIHRVEPSMIRVDADEVTYNLHVQLRYEIERDLFAGQLQVQDLEAAWNEKMQKLLGICPKNAFEGYLQDVHWSAGLVGYFPTYTLGNLCAASLCHAMEQDLGNLDELLACGSEAKILSWMREKVHVHGRKWTSRELLVQATGSELSSSAFKSYIEKKYSAFLG